MESLLSQIEAMKPEEFPSAKAWAIYCQGFKGSPHHSSPYYEWMGREGQIMVDVMFYHQLPAVSLYESIKAFVELKVIKGLTTEAVFQYMLEDDGEDMPPWADALRFYVDFYMRIHIEEHKEALKNLLEEMFYLNRLYGRKGKPITIKID